MGVHENEKNCSRLWRRTSCPTLWALCQIYVFFYLRKCNCKIGIRSKSRTQTRLSAQFLSRQRRCCCISWRYGRRSCRHFSTTQCRSCDRCQWRCAGSSTGLSAGRTQIKRRCLSRTSASWWMRRTLSENFIKIWERTVPKHITSVLRTVLFVVLWQLVK